MAERVRTGRKSKKVRQRNPWLMGGVAAALIVVVFVAATFYISSKRSAPDYTGSTDPTIAGNLTARLGPDAYYLPQVYFLGDSYTIGTSTADDMTWADRVSTMRGWTGIKYGSEGSGYATRGSNGLSYTEMAYSFQFGRASMVIVSGGFNDRSVTDTVFEDNVKSTLNKLRERAPQAVLVVISSFWPQGSVPPDILSHNEILRSEAKIVDAIFVEASELFVTRPELILSDNVDPSAEGQQLIADTISPQLPNLTPMP